MVNTRLRRAPMNGTISQRRAGRFGPFACIWPRIAALTPRLRGNAEFQEVVLANPIHRLLRTGSAVPAEGANEFVAFPGLIAIRRRMWDGRLAREKRSLAGTEH